MSPLLFSLLVSFFTRSSAYRSACSSSSRPLFKYKRTHELTHLLPFLVSLGIARRFTASSKSILLLPRTLPLLYCLQSRVHVFLSALPLRLYTSLSPCPPSHSPFSFAQLDSRCKFSCFLILLLILRPLVVLALAVGFSLHSVKGLLLLLLLASPHSVTSMAQDKS